MFQESENANPKCGICFDPAKPGYVFTPCCWNPFCKDCLQKWLTSHHTCPRDRKPLDINSCGPSARILDHILNTTGGVEDKFQKFKKHMERFDKQVIYKIESLGRSISKEDICDICDFVEISDENQEVAMEKGLIERLDSTLQTGYSISLEIRRYIFKILCAMCNDDNARRNSLRLKGMAHLLSMLLVIRNDDNSKQLNHDILHLFENFLHRLSDDKVDICSKNVVLHEKDLPQFCRKMETIHSVADGSTDDKSIAIKLITAYLAFQLSPFSVGSVCSTKFFDTLLFGVLQNSFFTKKRAAFFTALENASKAVSNLASFTISLGSLSNLLGCLQLNEVCGGWRVLDIILALDEKIVGEDKKKKVLEKIYHAFTSNSATLCSQKNPDTSVQGPLYGICTIMQIVNSASQTNTYVLLPYIESTYPQFAHTSLCILDILIQKPLTNEIEKKTKTQILLFHSKFIKHYICYGPQGTAPVMSRVIANYPKFTTREDVRTAVAIIVACNSSFLEWK